jgi:hypothetical protein
VQPSTDDKAEDISDSFQVLALPRQLSVSPVALPQQSYRKLMTEYHTEKYTVNTSFQKEVEQKHPK